MVNFTIFLEVLIGLVLSYWGWLMVEEEVVAYPDWQRTTGLELPFFIPKLGIFLGFVFMTFIPLCISIADCVPGRATSGKITKLHHTSDRQALC
ncbi:hypothetical protein [Aliamphritea spongicola]|nr:hypothetical protein [Aliamphritea spongicola]